MKVKTSLLLILAVALALRLVYGLAQNPLLPYTAEGGDSGWYLMNGYTLFTNETVPGMPVDVSRLPTPPVYLLIIGFWQAVLPQAEAVIAIRVMQAVMGTGLCWFAYRLARILSGERAGLIAAGVLAISPVFVIESAQVLSETVYLFLLGGGLVVLVESLNKPDMREWRAPVLSGILLGLATLTRGVLLLYPLAFSVYLLVIYGVRRGWRSALVLLTVYSCVVLTWTGYNLIRWNRLVIAQEGFAAFLYIGATEWEGPEAVDAALEAAVPDAQSQSEAYTQAASSVIAADPLGYVMRRVTALTEALLQPHGTTLFPGESLRDLAVNWVRGDRTIAGLERVFSGEAFWPKLALYVFHYAGWILGVAGIWHLRKQWRLMLPLAGLIAYTVLVHLPLLVLPRYLFPTQFALWVLAAALLSSILPRRPMRQDAAAEVILKG